MTDHWKDVPVHLTTRDGIGTLAVYPCDAVDRALAAERRDHSIAIAMLKSEGVAARAKDAASHAAELAAKDAEIGSYKHEHALLEADTMRGITDCSTPIFQRVRNIVEQLEAAESERDTLRAQRQQVTTERNAADARLAEVEAERDESEAQVESLRAQLDQQAQRYNAALDRLIADKDQLSLAGSHLRAQLAAVQSATPEAVTRELERGHYSIIRAWLALHGGTSAQIAVEEMAQLVRSFGEPLTLQEPKA